jgi:hypothetical protein
MRQKLLGSAATSEGERLEVVADLLNIRVRGCAVSGLEGEEVDQGRLGTFDLRGEHRLLADERIDEPVERWHQLARELEPVQRMLGGAESIAECGIEHQMGVGRRQRGRNEGRDLLSGIRSSLVSTGGTLAHRPGSARNGLVPVANRKERIRSRPHR